MKAKNLIFMLISIVLLASCTNKTGLQMRVSGEPNFAGAYQEMNTPVFWISGIENPDKRIMSASEIEEFNKNILTTAVTNCIDLNGYKSSLSKAELLENLRQYEIPEEVRYIKEMPIDENYYKQLSLNRNEAGVMEQNPVRLGVIIQNTELRSWPTANVSYSSINDIEFDMGCETVLKTSERVAVLHESTDKEWLYVQAYNYIGWIKAVDIAFCTEDEWKLIGENSDWLTVTGNRILLDYSNLNTKVSRRELTMGTRLMLLKDKQDVIDGISTVGSHVVLLPTRDENGGLELTETRVPQALDVTEGFLQYTSKNVIEQSFKMFGERYGWGSLWNARDCASFIMDIYQCFGITLPRNASNQAAVAGKRVDVSNYSDEDKQALILDQPVGTLLEFNGHIMMYLGAYGGKPYVIHQVYSFIPKSETVAAKVSSVLVSDLEIKRNVNKKSFISEIRTVNVMN